MPKSLRSARSMVCEEGFVERSTEGTAGGIADGTAKGISAGIADGEGRNSFANSEGCARSEGSVAGEGAHSVCTGSAGRAKSAAAESGGVAQ